MDIFDHTGQYACFSPVLQAAERLERAGVPALVAIDGRCGSGKTTLAALLAAKFPCNVFHTDDFYLPPASRIPGWESVPCANLDLDRLDREILRPVLAGEDVDYRPYRCASGDFAPAIRIPFRPLNVLEGSYALHPALRMRYTLRIFLTCSPEEQTRRLQAREGDRFPLFQHRWIPLEESYFRTCGVEACCHIILHTDSIP